MTTLPVRLVADQGAAGDTWPVADADALGQLQATVAALGEVVAALAGTLTVGGTIAVSNQPTIPTPQTDALTRAELDAAPVEVTGDLTVTGNVVVANPTTTVAVSNLPTPQTDALTNAQLRAADVNTADSGEREYAHVVETVTASGDTTVYTPAAGKRVRLRWIYAVNDPTSSAAPLIKIRLGASEKYRVYALSKRQIVTGPVDGPLVVNLSTAASVAVTALIEEA